MTVFFFITHTRQLKFLTKQGGISNQTERGKMGGGDYCEQREAKREGEDFCELSVNRERQNGGRLL